MGPSVCQALGQLKLSEWGAWHGGARAGAQGASHAVKRNLGFFSGPCEPLKVSTWTGRCLCDRWVESREGEAVRWPTPEVGRLQWAGGGEAPWSLLEVRSPSASAGEVGAVVAQPPPAWGWRGLEEGDLRPLRLCARSRGALGSGAPPGLRHRRGFDLKVMLYGA